jgi:hypothetical protein
MGPKDSRGGPQSIMHTAATLTLLPDVTGEGDSKVSLVPPSGLVSVLCLSSPIQVCAPSETPAVRLKPSPPQLAPTLQSHKTLSSTIRGQVDPKSLRE